MISVIRFNEEVLIRVEKCNRINTFSDVWIYIQELIYLEDNNVFLSIWKCDHNVGKK